MVLAGDGWGAVGVRGMGGLGDGGDKCAGALGCEDVFDADGDRGEALLHCEMVEHFRAVESIFRSTEFAIQMGL